MGRKQNDFIRVLLDQSDKTLWHSPIDVFFFSFSYTTRPPIDVNKH